MSNGIEQLLREHLRLESVDGLPLEWFAAKAPSRPVKELYETEISMKSLSAVEETSPAALQYSAVLPSAVGGEVSLAETMDWDLLEQVASSCRKCRLCDERNKVVFGTGKRSAPLIAFVGEGPGADEDRVGEPFVGRAGQLLTAAIVKGMGLRREDVYICNVVKCRAPNNRAPLPDEVENCTPYLYRQLELLQPRVIITLGQPAQLALSGVKVGITKLRGTWQEWRGVKLMPTYHPAYLLRNPAMKRYFWDDLKLVMNELGLKHENSKEAVA